MTSFQSVKVQPILQKLTKARQFIKKNNLQVLRTSPGPLLTGSFVNGCKVDVALDKQGLHKLKMIDAPYPLHSAK